MKDMKKQMQNRMRARLTGVCLLGLCLSGGAATDGYYWPDWIYDLNPWGTIRYWEGDRVPGEGGVAYFTGKMAGNITFTSDVKLNGLIPREQFPIMLQRRIVLATDIPMGSTAEVPDHLHARRIRARRGDQPNLPAQPFKMSKTKFVPFHKWRWPMPVHLADCEVTHQMDAPKEAF